MISVSFSALLVAHLSALLIREKKCVWSWVIDRCQSEPSWCFLIARENSAWPTWSVCCSYCKLGLKVRRLVTSVNRWVFFKAYPHLPGYMYISSWNRDEHYVVNRRYTLSRDGPAMKTLQNLWVSNSDKFRKVFAQPCSALAVGGGGCLGAVSPIVHISRERNLLSTEGIRSECRRLSSSQLGRETQTR